MAKAKIGMLVCPKHTPHFIQKYKFLFRHGEIIGIKGEAVKVKIALSFLIKNKKSYKLKNQVTEISPSDLMIFSGG